MAFKPSGLFGKSNNFLSLIVGEGSPQGKWLSRMASLYFRFYIESVYTIESPFRSRAKLSLPLFPRGVVFTMTRTPFEALL